MPKSLKQLIDKPVVISALIISIFLGIGTILGFSLISSQTSNTFTKMAYLTVIPVSSGIENQVQSTVTINPTDNSKNPKGAFPKGSQVTVEGTGNEGLRIHSDAGTNFPTMFLAQDGDKFIILEGPRVANGYAWWKVGSSENANMEGWVVQDFITLAAN